MTQADQTIQIELLADHTDAIPMLASWYEDEWRPYYGGGGPGDARADLESRRNRDALPIGVVAIDEGRVVGTAALDTDPATKLAPSVVGLLVKRGHRRRGIGRALIESSERLAGRLGYSRLYVSTNVLDDLLLATGWQAFGDAEFLNDERGSIYVRIIRGQ